MEIAMILKEQEIKEYIDYYLIYETHSRSIWKTQYCRRLWKVTFNDEESEKCKELLSQAHTWSTKGLPKSTIVTTSTMDLWYKLVEFCLILCDHYAAHKNKLNKKEETV